MAGAFADGKGGGVTRDGDFELVTLRGGARAVRHMGHGEVMHPAGGPWAEANRLYVEQPALAQRLGGAGRAGRSVVILDVGLGAATNAVAALSCARACGGRVEIHSFEIDLAPLRLALGDGAGFPFLQPFADAARALMADGSWAGPEGRWILHQGDALDWLATLGARGMRADLVFFDPFSPQHNSRLWTAEAFAAVRACCEPGGRCDGDAEGRSAEPADGALLMTYSAATPTRVSMLLAGFFVGSGLSTGSKRETTVAATQRSDLVAPLAGRWLQRWGRSSARGPVGSQTLTPQMEAAVLAHPQFAADLLLDRLAG